VDLLAKTHVLRHLDNSLGLGGLLAAAEPLRGAKWFFVLTVAGVLPPLLQFSFAARAPMPLQLRPKAMQSGARESA